MNGAPAEDRPRLSAQVLAIVRRLRIGPVTNRELSQLSLKYTSRISDARQAGYEIECTRIHDGLTEYRLVREPGSKPEQLQLRIA